MGRKKYDQNIWAQLVVGSYVHASGKSEKIRCSHVCAQCCAVVMAVVDIRLILVERRPRDKATYRHIQRAEYENITPQVQFVPTYCLILPTVYWDGVAQTNEELDCYSTTTGVNQKGNVIIAIKSTVSSAITRDKNTVCTPPRLTETLPYEVLQIYI